MRLGTGRRPPAGLAVALVVAAAPVAGAVAAIPGAECLSIPVENARLACFDRAVGEAARAAPAPQSAEAPAGALPAAPPSLIDSAWGFLPDSRKAYVRLHQPNYLLFARYTTDVNREPYEPLFEAFAEDYDFEDVEAKFQISLKGRLAATEDRRWGLWFAYTQQSQWQVYSGDISSPFRETNYTPELFGSFRPGVDLGGLTRISHRGGCIGPVIEQNLFCDDELALNHRRARCRHSVARSSWSFHVWRAAA